MGLYCCKISVKHCNGPPYDPCWSRVDFSTSTCYFPTPIISHHLLTMAPIHKKYNWSNKTLAMTIPCWHCRNILKPQDLRSHELHCVQRKGKEWQCVQSGMEFEHDLIKDMQLFWILLIFTWHAISSAREVQQQMGTLSYTYPDMEAGPSRSFSSNSPGKFSFLFLLLV